jgi:uroporphyrinogen decarboxylase
MHSAKNILNQPIEELTKNRPPDFEQLLKVLRNETPDRPVLFEMSANVMAAHQAMGDQWLDDGVEFAGPRNFINAHRVLGYDYSVAPVWPYQLTTGGANGKREKQQNVHSHSLNDTAPIYDEKSFESYDWPMHQECEYERMKELASWIPEGMRLVLRGGSIQEGLIKLVGFDNLCMMYFENPELIAQIVDRLGHFVLEHYQLALRHDFFGAALHSDDWGFKTQTLMPPDFLRQFIIPWHQRIVDAVHQLGRPMILHSCGQIDAVMEDVINVAQYDAKHSFEDEIIPIEEYYEKWQGRIALLGGIDVDYLCRATAEQVFERSRGMLDRSRECGGYALGSGNSIPEYVPEKKYHAMLKAAMV